MGNNSSTIKEDTTKFQTERNNKLTKSLENAAKIAGEIAALKKELKGKKDDIKQRRLNELEEKLKNANKIKYLKYKMKYLQLQ
jgi:hypothetical protein